MFASLDDSLSGRRGHSHVYFEGPRPNGPRPKVFQKPNIIKIKINSHAICSQIHKMEPAKNNKNCFKFETLYAHQVHRIECTHVIKYETHCNVLKKINCCKHQYCVSINKLMLPGNIELNRHPLTDPATANVVLPNRIQSELESRPLNGGDNDCFFGVVSHQIHGDPNNHNIRSGQGVRYLGETTDGFIENNAENSWEQCQMNTSVRGICSHVLINANYAHAPYFRIYIIKSGDLLYITNTVFVFRNSLEYLYTFVNLVCKNTSKFKQSSCYTLNSVNIAGNIIISNEQRHLSLRKLLLSGDIELNPGPIQNSSLTTLSTNVLLEQRLEHFQLKPFDVGGNGDCFFRAVSHQLYGEQHFQVRAAGVAYMRDNPERFIESNTEVSWLEYLNNMSMQGTWGDAMIIQAVADQLKLKMTIAETHDAFSEYSIIQPVGLSSTQQLKDIYLGHINECHYVSALPCSSKSGFVAIQATQFTRSFHSNETGMQYTKIANVKQKTTTKQSPETKEKKRQYIREYRKRKRANNSCHAPAISREAKQKKRQYAKRYRKQKRLEFEPLPSLISKFHDDIAQGPLYIFTCCDQLWYRHSVISATALKEKNPDIQNKVLNKKSVDNVEWLCKTCNMHLQKNKVPPCAAMNGLQFPKKPSFFDLNELECRLLAPRLAFQKLMQAPRGGQLKVNGNIVNIPADVVNTVNMLPRLPNETSTIKVNLKRRLQYKSSALSLNVRPNKVAEAAKWLINNGNLYKDEGITFNDTWLEENPNAFVFDDNNNDQTVDGSENVVNCNAKDPNGHTKRNAQKTSECDDDDGQCSEDEAETAAGVTDTMLSFPDFVTDNERQHILNVAPGEGNMPMSIFRDKYSEELAYPGIFLGQKRPDNTTRFTKVHYSEICKSELRRSDRRAATCVENIFFKAKKLQMKILLGQTQIALRKCQQNSSTITAGQLKQPGALDNMVHRDQGLKFLRAVRGSPPYFEKAKRDIFAMIRQLGPASIFCSSSSAETKWIHLLRILGKLVDNKTYTDTQLGREM